MVTLATPSPLDRILSTDVRNITGLLLGTAGYGQQVQLVRLSDATNYANTLGNADTTNGRALKVQYGDPASPTTLATFQKSGITLQSNDGTKSLTISNAGISMSGGFLVFDVKSSTYGAVGDGTTDDTSAIQAAISAAGAAGGGIVYFPSGIYRITSRLTVSSPNVRLVGLGMADDDTGQRSSIKIDFTSMPAIVLGGTNVQHNGSWTGIEDLLLIHNSAPSGATYEGGTVSATICLDRCGYQSGSGTSAVVTGRVVIRRVRFASAVATAVQIGTVNTPAGAGAAWVEDCEGSVTDNFVRVLGCPYLFVRRNFIEEVAAAGGVFVYLTGAMGATAAPDGLFIQENFTEDFAYAVLDEHSSGSVGNAMINDNTFDGCATVGIYLNPSGSGVCNRWLIQNNVITGASVANSIGIRLTTASTAEIKGCSILGNRIADFGDYGILSNAPASATGLQDLVVANNLIVDCSKDADGGAEGILVDSNTDRFQILRNVIRRTTSTGNRVSRGVSVGSGCTNFAVIGNVALDAATAAVNKGTTGNGTTAIYQDNYGPVASGDMVPSSYTLIGPFHAANAAAGGTDVAMNTVPSDGTASNAPTFIPAPFNGRVVGVLLGATANIAGATLTVKGSIAGSATTLALSITAAAATDRGVATQTSGDTFTSGQKLGMLYTTPGGFTTNDLHGYLMVVPT